MSLWFFHGPVGRGPESIVFEFPAPTVSQIFTGLSGVYWEHRFSFASVNRSEIPNPPPYSKAVSATVTAKYSNHGLRCGCIWISDFMTLLLSCHNAEAAIKMIYIYIHRTNTGMVSACNTKCLPKSRHLFTKQPPHPLQDTVLLRIIWMIF